MKEPTLKRWIVLGDKLAAIISNLSVWEGLSTNNIVKEIASAGRDFRFGTLEKGFPNIACIGCRNTICHGLPSDERVSNDDLVKVDIVLGNGEFYVDSCWTFLIGKKYRNFWMRSYLAFALTVLSLIRKRDIDYTIKTGNNLFQKLGLGVVNEFSGHGIGTEIHQEPEINFSESQQTNRKGKIRNFQALTIEPILYEKSKSYRISLHKKHEYRDLLDGNFAMFEHTILFLPSKTLILTLNKLDEKHNFLRKEYPWDRSQKT